MNKKKKELLVAVLGIIGVLVLTIGVTYSLLRYMREGSTENTITTGKITFLYTETSFGRGIKLENAMPMSDELGIAQKGEGKVFDFKITANTMKSTSIPYDVTVVKQPGSDLKESDVKKYISEVNDNVEENSKVGKFNDDLIYPKYNGSSIERKIYKGKVPGNSSNYEKNFRLKMWVDKDAEFSPEIDETTGEYKIVDGEYVYPNNNKTFKVKVNVYANSKVLTPDEIDEENNVDTLGVTANGKALTLTDEKVAGYRYETELTNAKTANITVTTESQTAKVKIDKVATPDINAPSIQNMSYTKNLKLTSGDNYFRVTVDSENNSEHDRYIIKINLIIDTLNREVNSILEGLEDPELETGTYIFNVTAENKTVSYPIRVYVYDGDQNWTTSTNTIFGEKADVGDATHDASRMVAVKVNGNLTINNGVTVRPYVYTDGNGKSYGGPKGFTLYVTGTLTNNSGGTIDNSYGAKAVGEDVYLLQNEDGTYAKVPAIGGAGGDAVGSSTTDIAGNPGKAGSGRSTGGGGSGAGAQRSGQSGSGSAGTSYSGGTGGAAAYGGGGNAGLPNGGAGGDGTGNGNAGGGAGNPGGYSSSEKPSQNGTGGLLVIYANNYINNGTVSAHGADGSNSFVGGGSSGGGSINIFYSNTLTKGTAPNVNGGNIVGTHSVLKGGAGGLGTVTYSYKNPNTLSNTDIRSIKVSNNIEVSKINNQNYDYEVALEENTSSTTLNIQTVNPKATINVEPINSLAYSETSNIKQMASSNNISLVNGINYFKITVTTPNETIAEYKLKVNVGKPNGVYTSKNELLTEYNNSSINSISCNYTDLSVRTYFNCSSYSNIQEAINSKDKSEVIITKDATFDSNLNIAAGKKVDLDINGKHLDFGENYIISNGTLNLTSSANGGTMNGINCVVRVDGGTTNIENVHLYTTTDTNNGYATIVTRTGATVNIRGEQATYDGNGNYVSGMLIEGNENSCINSWGGTINVYNGTFKKAGAYSTTQAAIRENNAAKTTINIYNANIDGRAVALGTNCSSESVVNIYDGTYASSNVAAIQNDSPGTINIYGGTYFAEKYLTIRNTSTGTINITQTTKPIHISNVSTDFKAGVSNAGAGTFKITANQANQCTSNASSTTSGLCVYSIGNGVYTDVNNASCAVELVTSGNTYINGGTYYGGSRTINAGGSSTGTINITNARIYGGYGSITNNGTGTINICGNTVMSKIPASTASYYDLNNGKTTGKINYSSTVKFNSNNNVPTKSGSGSSKITGSYSGTCVAN